VTPVTPDLSFNISHAIYAMFIHNYILAAYLLGLFISIILAIKKPTRFNIFLILGFAILAFSFEYDKHIAEGLRKQTLQSMITVQPHYQMQKWINIVVGDVMPVFLYILGWFLIYTAIIVASLRNKKISKKKCSGS